MVHQGLRNAHFNHQLGFPFEYCIGGELMVNRKSTRDLRYCATTNGVPPVTGN